MFALRIAALVAAVLATGLTAGVFYAYAISVMPALNRSDDRTIVDVMQKINVVIINPWFMIAFMGTVAFGILAAVLHLGREHRATLVWIAIAVALNVIAFAVTAGFNVPLNDQLAAAGDPGQIADMAAVRANYEADWVRYNVIRAVVHTLAFLVLCGALFAAGVQQGKSEAAGPAQGATGSAQGVTAYAAPAGYGPQYPAAPRLG
ncbi:anthrone oxygenase family protein [Nocardia sp. NPDC004654]|uniref:anthrone oxygenase family protein n=1 Tax=Nocardia sp. NPDC004654 TaxID=3154776 RepID=UPI0033B66DAA